MMEIRRVLLLLVGMWLALGLPAGGAGAGVVELGPRRTVSLEVGEGRLLRLGAPTTAVFVAAPAVADVQVQAPDLVWVYGRRAGTTTLYAVGEEQRPLLEARIEVRHALGRLQALLRRIAPEAPLRVESFPGGLLVEGQVRDPATAADVGDLVRRFLGEGEKLIARVRVSRPTQVTLRVRVAEVSREVLQILGVNWNVVATPGDTVFSLATGRPLGTGAALSRLVGDAGAAGLLSGGVRNGDLDLAGVLDALAREGLVSMLAEPTLTARSGETAAFLAGGEFPVPVGVDNGDISIEFREFGVRLAFTPTVLDDRRISLRVRPEVSELTDTGAIRLQNIAVPALATRKAETTVELASGQSLAIGGLISRSTRSQFEKFPGLGDLPVLGALFRSTRFQRNESELLIVVTPYLVRPTTPQRLSLPQERLRPQDGFLALLRGRIEAPVQDLPTAERPRALHGRYGFAWE